MSDPETLGIVGLGTMGGAMARHFIDAGWAVIGYDRDDTALAQAAADGVTPAESPAAVAGRAASVITSLPTPDAVSAVYLDDDGLDAGADGDMVALETSTIDPETSSAIAETVTRLDLLDAPVSGGPERARDGTLTVMVGGPEVVLDQDDVQMVLSTLGEEVYHLGPVGAGHTTKLLNNLIGAGIRTVSMEAAAIAAVMGVDWEAFTQAVRHSSGSSYMFRKRMPRVLNRDFRLGFAVAASRKDIGLALDMADAIDAPTPMATSVYELHKRAVAEGLGDEDHGAIVKLFERSTGVPVESTEPIDDDLLDWREI